MNADRQKAGRPLPVRISVVMEAASAAAALAVASYVYAQSFDPKLIAEGRDTIHGLYIGAAVVGGAGLVFAAATVLLWKRCRTGWWLSLGVNAVAVFAFLYDPLLENDPLISEDSAVGLWFLVTMVLLFFPAVRRWMFRREAKILAADQRG